MQNFPLDNPAAAACRSERPGFLALNPIDSEYAEFTKGRSKLGFRAGLSVYYYGRRTSPRGRYIGTLAYDWDTHEWVAEEDFSFVQRKILTGYERVKSPVKPLARCRQWTDALNVLVRAYIDDQEQRAHSSPTWENLSGGAIA